MYFETSNDRLEGSDLKLKEHFLNWFLLRAFLLDFLLQQSSLHLLTDGPQLIGIAVSIHPLALMVDPRAHHHAHTVSVLRVGSGPDLIVREGSGAIRVGPQVLTRVGEVCSQTDGEPLIGRFVSILHPMLNTGPLFSALVYRQNSTEQSRIN